MSRRAGPMMGLVFGKLTVIAEATRGAAGQPRFLCRCECGAEVVRIGAALRYAVSHGQQPNCGECKRGPNSVEARREAGRHRAKVTISNYRELRAAFDPEQEARFDLLMLRHDREMCGACARGRACDFAVEAVENVLLADTLGLDRPRDVEPSVALDYRRQGMYA